MKIPVGVKLLILVLVSTAFYTYVGQLVPQKEVPAPVIVDIPDDITTADMIQIGEELANGRGLCTTCHTIGQTGGGLRFPDLGGIGGRAATRLPGMDDVEYLAQSLYEPDIFVVEGYNPGMPVINENPIGLSDEEILCVIAWLQSLGGEATVTLETTHSYRPEAGS